MPAIVTRGVNMKAILSVRTSRRGVERPPRIDDENVVPFRLTSLEAEPYVLKNGFPDVPPVWVKAEPLVSISGEYQLLNRPSPTEQHLQGARARFVAVEDTWDDIAGVWSPVASEGINYKWITTAGSEPSLDEITYRLGKEVFTQSAMRFLPGDFMTSSFNEGIDDATDYTVAMVVSLEVPTGYQVLRSGGTKASGVGISVNEDFDFSYGGVNASVNVPQHPARMTPVYLILSVGAPRCTLWVGTAPNRMQRMQIQASHMGSRPFQFSLGQDWASVADATMYIMDMAFFPHEASFYPDSETPYPSVFQIMNYYTNIYGAWG